MTRRIVFVTGGAGFIGSNIVARLCADPTLDVVVCDRLHEVDRGKWRNIAKHPIGDFVAPEQMFDWHRTVLADEGRPAQTWINGVLDFTKKSLELSNPISADQVFDFSFVDTK